MAQKPSQRLQTVLKLARIKQQQAAEVLGATTRNALATQQQDQQLRHYQQEYAQHFKSIAATGMSAAQMANYQQFYGNLEQAIETQGERMVLAESQLQQARELWQKQYSREKNMAALIDQKKQEEDIALEKKTQRTLDDRQSKKPLST